MKWTDRFAIFLISSVLAVDSLLFGAITILLLALGGYIGHIWPASPLYLLITAIIILAVVAIYAFVIIPLTLDIRDNHDGDGGYPGS